MPSSSSKYSPSLVALLLVLVTLGTFWQVRNFGFIHYDDGTFLVENPMVSNGLSWENVRQTFKGNFLWDGVAHAKYWAPVTNLSHMLDFQMFGRTPFGHHVVNLLIHVLNVQLLFLILRKVTGEIHRAAWVSLLFAIHPVNVESVAWIVERKGLLSTFWTLLSLGAYVHYSKSKSGKAYFLSLGCFALALMSKATVIMLPVLLLFWDVWPLKRDVIKRKIFLEKIPFFVLAVLAGLQMFFYMRNAKNVVDLTALSIFARISNALVSYVKYIGKVLFPHDLAVFYPHPGNTLPIAQVMGAVLFLLLVTVAVIRLRKTHSYFLMGWLWYMISLLPVIGLLQAGGQAMADRYLYVPILGLLLMLVWGSVDLGQFLFFKSTKKVFKILSGAIPIVLIPLSWIQAGYWRDSGSLFEHALTVTSNDNDLAHLNLAVALVEKGDLDGAEFHLMQVLRIKPHNADALNNFGVVMAKKGNVADAEKYFQEALSINPRLVDAWNNMGTTFTNRNEWAKANACYEKAIALNSNYLKAYVNLGNNLLRLGKWDQGIEQYEQALKLNHEHAESHYKLSLVFAVKGKNAESEKHLQMAGMLDVQYANPALFLNDLNYLRKITVSP